MAVDQLLLTYGPLGLWTASLLTERYWYNKKMSRIISDNTRAMNNVIYFMDEKNGRKRR